VVSIHGLYTEFAFALAPALNTINSAARNIQQWRQVQFTTSIINTIAAPRPIFFQSQPPAVYNNKNETRSSHS
jgi:hypothetical protein